MRELTAARAGHDPAEATTPGPAVHQSRLPGVEGARGIAALSVLAFHVWLRGAGGAVLGYGWNAAEVARGLT